MLHCEGSGSLDLGEIYQCRPSECCAFDLRILTFAYSLKEKLPRTPRQAHIELWTPCTLRLSRGGTSCQEPFGFLHRECYGSLDLGEIFQFRL